MNTGLVRKTKTPPRSFPLLIATEHFFEGAL